MYGSPLLFVADPSCIVRTVMLYCGCQLPKGAVAMQGKRIAFRFEARSGRVRVVCVSPHDGQSWCVIVMGLPSVDAARSFMLDNYNGVVFSDYRSGSFEEFSC